MVLIKTSSGEELVDQIKTSDSSNIRSAKKLSGRLLEILREKRSRMNGSGSNGVAKKPDDDEAEKFNHSSRAKIFMNNRVSTREKQTSLFLKYYYG